MDDAEKWNGHGDLMHSPFSREHLSLEKPGDGSAKEKRLGNQENQP
jgi:hypothetical protein